MQLTDEVMRLCIRQKRRGMLVQEKLPDRRMEIFCMKKITNQTHGSKKPFHIKTVVIWGLQIYIIYGIQHGIVNMIQYFHESIEEKVFYYEKEEQQKKY